MNAIQHAKASIQRLAAMMRSTTEARAAFQAKRLPAPRATQLRAESSGMVRVVDMDTGRVLGFRQTFKEARWLQRALENGTHTQAHN